MGGDMDKIEGELRALWSVDEWFPRSYLEQCVSEHITQLARSLIFARMDSGELEEGLVLDVGGHRAKVLVCAEMADLLAEDSRRLKGFVSDLDPELRGELLPGPYAKKSGARITKWGDEDVH
ncbi:hypothetical protein [Profundibacter sp.]